MRIECASGVDTPLAANELKDLVGKFPITVSALKKLLRTTATYSKKAACPPCDRLYDIEKRLNRNTRGTVINTIPCLCQSDVIEKVNNGPKIFLLSI